MDFTSVMWMLLVSTFANAIRDAGPLRHDRSAERLVSLARQGVRSPVVERGTSLRRWGSVGSQQPAPARTAFDDRIRPAMLPLSSKGASKGFPKDFLRLRQLLSILSGEI
jgi:hypothetical protein